MFRHVIYINNSNVQPGYNHRSLFTLICQTPVLDPHVKSHQNRSVSITFRTGLRAIITTYKIVMIQSKNASLTSTGHYIFEYTLLRHVTEYICIKSLLNSRIKTYRTERIQSVPYTDKIEELRGLTTTAWSMVWRLLILELALLIASLYNIKNKIK